MVICTVLTPEPMLAFIQLIARSTQGSAAAEAAGATINEPRMLQLTTRANVL